MSSQNSLSPTTTQQQTKPKRLSQFAKNATSASQNMLHPSTSDDLDQTSVHQMHHKLSHTDLRVDHS